LIGAQFLLLLFFLFSLILLLLGSGLRCGPFFANGSRTFCGGALRALGSLTFGSGPLGGRTLGGRALDSGTRRLNCRTRGGDSRR
jgi:hypothetical protein